LLLRNHVRSVHLSVALHAESLWGH
jgi:hypothetical protein